VRCERGYDGALGYRAGPNETGAAMLTLLFALQLSTEMASSPAILNLQRLMAESIEGKAVMARLENARTEHLKTLEGKRAEINQLIQKKATATSIERSQVELERLTDDANAQMTELQRALQLDFFKKVEPVASQIAVEDKLGMVFTFPNPNIVWTGPSVDITAKVIQRLNDALKKPLQ
jgi:Skp family chaperone for outer membrane proteins